MTLHTKGWVATCRNLGWATLAATALLAGCGGGGTGDATAVNTANTTGSSLPDAPLMKAKALAAQDYYLTQADKILEGDASLSPANYDPDRAVLLAGNDPTSKHLGAVWYNKPLSTERPFTISTGSYLKLGAGAKRGDMFFVLHDGSFHYDTSLSTHKKWVASYWSIGPQNGALGFMVPQATGHCCSTPKAIAALDGLTSTYRELEITYDPVTKKLTQNARVLVEDGSFLMIPEETIDIDLKTAFGKTLVVGFGAGNIGSPGTEQVPERWSVAQAPENRAPVWSGEVDRSTVMNYAPDYFLPFPNFSDGSYRSNLASNFTDPDGDVLTYKASGLPPGLVLSSDGFISGQPSQSGTYKYQLTATDTSGAATTIRGKWTMIGSQLSVSTPQIDQVGNQLTFSEKILAPPSVTGVKYFWKFGDNTTYPVFVPSYHGMGGPQYSGDPTTAATIKHTYAAPGTYTVTLYVLETNGYYTTKTFTVVVTAADLVPSGTGLKAEYFNNPFLYGTPVLTRTEAVDFDWGLSAPAANLRANLFSARWSGSVMIPSAGQYQFRTRTDDGVRLFVDGKRVINDWTVHGATDDTSPVLTLTAGKHSIVMEYFEATGYATAKLLMKAPGATQFTVVPAKALYP